MHPNTASTSYTDLSDLFDLPKFLFSASSILPRGFPGEDGMRYRSVQHNAQHRVNVQLVPVSL